MVLVTLIVVVVVAIIGQVQLLLLMSQHRLAITTTTMLSTHPVMPQGEPRSRQQWRGIPRQSLPSSTTVDQTQLVVDVVRVVATQ